MNSKQLFLVLGMFAISVSCNSSGKNTQQPISANTYPRWVGDIEHDPTKDSSSFQPCHGDDHIYQYFNNSEQGALFEGGKIAFENYFRKKYQPIDTEQSGWIRIRFVVNCKGETGRFRLLEADENYQERPFDKKISSQLMELSKELKGWKIQTKHGDAIDYYQYLIFKMDNGHIEKVMP